MNIKSLLLTYRRARNTLTLMKKFCNNFVLLGIFLKSKNLLSIQVRICKYNWFSIYFCMICMYAYTFHPFKCPLWTHHFHLSMIFRKSFNKRELTYIPILLPTDVYMCCYIQSGKTYIIYVLTLTNSWTSLLPYILHATFLFYWNNATVKIKYDLISIAVTRMFETFSRLLWSGSIVILDKTFAQSFFM